MRPVTVAFWLAGLQAIQASDYAFTEVLYSGSTGRRGGGRSAVFTDPVMYQRATGNLAPPRVGEPVGTSFRGEEVRWTRIGVDEDGTFQLERTFGGWIYLALDAAKDEAVILQANGNSELIVNGVPRAGDVYAKGRVLLPVKLRQGRNEFWYKVSRGRKKSLTMTAPRQPVYLTGVGSTLPDLLTNETDVKWAMIRVVNATDEALHDLKLACTLAGETVTHQPEMTGAPMTTRKIPFKIPDAVTAEGRQTATVRLWVDGKRVDEIGIGLEAKNRSQNYRRTFISDIDGSVQYYAVREIAWRE